MKLETHGRWPLVGIVAAGPVTAVAIDSPRLRPLAALLWHQAEEWVWPGGFLPWVNREVLGSNRDEFPIDRRTGFAINVLYGWGFSIAASEPSRAPVRAAVLFVSHLSNLGLHASWALRHRRYDPGLITAVGALTPIAVSGLWRLRSDPNVSGQVLTRGVLAGVAISAGLIPALKLRMRRAR
jgi:hypothetical protein